MSLISLDGSLRRLRGSSSDVAAANEDEPPSRPRPSIFLLGRDSQGHWVAQNKAGTRGGLFVNREQALRYIRSEDGSRAFVMETGTLELNLAPAPRAHRIDAQRVRRVA